MVTEAERREVCEALEIEPHYCWEIVEDHKVLARTILEPQAGVTPSCWTRDGMTTYLGPYENESVSGIRLGLLDMLEQIPHGRLRSAHVYPPIDTDAEWSDRAMEAAVARLRKTHDAYPSEFKQFEVLLGYRPSGRLFCEIMLRVTLNGVSDSQAWWHEEDGGEPANCSVQRSARRDPGGRFQGVRR